MYRLHFIETGTKNTEKFRRTEDSTAEIRPVRIKGADIMDIKELLPKDTEGRLRIIQETVPGRQITLAHVITSPKPIVYRKLGLNPDIDFDRSAIGIITVTPSDWFTFHRLHYRSLT